MGLISFIKTFTAPKVLLSEKVQSDAEKQAEIDELARIAKENEKQAQKEKTKAIRATGIQKVRHQKTIEKVKEEHAKEVEALTSQLKNIQELEKRLEEKEAERKDAIEKVKLINTRTIRQR
jgi:hypothetical protein